MFRRTKSTAKRTTQYAKTVVNAEEIQRNAEAIAELAKKNFNPFQKHNARQESFWHAMERLGLKEADLPGTYRYHSNRFYLFSFFATMAIIFLVSSIVMGNLMGSLGAVAASFVFLAQMFNASFRCYQIRKHDLLPVKEWTKVPGEWLPGEYVPPRASGRSLKTRD